VRVGTEPAELAENSGIVVGRAHPEVLWAHNDSGNPFELFAQRLDGTIAARFPLTGGENVDIEDIAAGPCLDDRKQWCIYLGDIGDNSESRKEVAVYQVVEPERLDGAVLTARKLRFTYADRPHNAETLLVDPRSVELFVVTKEPAGLGAVYRLEGLAADKIGRAVPLRRLEQASGFSVLTTGGDVHPSGTRVLLRTYTGVFEYRGHAGESLDTILGTTPLTVTSAPQPQPEAIAYTADGRGYVLGSELPGTAIFRVDCAR